METLSLVEVIMGEDHTIDPNVVLGYKTGRKIELAPLVIGPHAKLRSGTVIYASTEIGSGFETGHNVTVREENRIGNDCAIWNNSTIDYGCVIGDRVKIHNNVYVAQYTTIEDDVFLAPGVMIANDPHPLCTKCMQGPTIMSGAKIGINSVVLAHVVVGRNSLVGAGSVVTKDVPEGVLVVGSPAKVVCKLDELSCPFGIVQPYVNGIDVKRRPEWDTVAPLVRPITRPKGK
jgi:acetyltransferase-like isoleucine patch superfamily enzyme